VDKDGDSIDKTACIMFNSRGIPIDKDNSPTGGNAFYLTDGTGVRAVTVTATPHPPLVVVGGQAELDERMTPARTRSTSPEAGFTLIETVFALTILMIVAAGVMPVALVAVRATENQGHLAARTTEYAQDKLEQLMSLSYGDSATDSR
jgi:hypothetical protein